MLMLSLVKEINMVVETVGVWERFYGFCSPSISYYVVVRERTMTCILVESMRASTCGSHSPQVIYDFGAPHGS